MKHAVAGLLLVAVTLFGVVTGYAIHATDQMLTEAQLKAEEIGPDALRIAEMLQYERWEYNGVTLYHKSKWIRVFPQTRRILVNEVDLSDLFTHYELKHISAAAHDCRARILRGYLERAIR